MEKHFEKYKSINQVYNLTTLEYYKQIDADKVQWYITEKIHGTNFSFLSDGVSVAYAQRSGITEGIFNSQAHVHQIENKILELSKKLERPIQVVCEFYGKGIVNKGAINYCNDHKDFIAYDIRFTDTDEFMSYPANFAWFDAVGISHPEVLFEGTMEECLKFNVEFDSPLAKTYGIITHAEGGVLKPFIDLRTQPNKDRVILKNVSVKFAESKFNSEEKKSFVDKNNELSNKFQTEESVTPRLTDVRMGKVAAKIGVAQTEKNKFGILIEALVEDISEEILRENQIEINKVLCKQMCVPLVKQFFN
jgi:Rnl2 family RNA ligase